MKSLLFLLAIFGAAMCLKQGLIERVVCDTWRGWGEGFAGEACGKSINSSCAELFDVFPELVDFFITFDFSKLGTLVKDIYEAVIEMALQFRVCNYIKYLIDFFPHLYRFFRDIFSNWMKIQGDVICVIQNWSHEDFYHAGICLGNIFKIIIAA